MYVAMGNDLFSAQNSPLTAEQAETLNRLVSDLSSEQLTWISGYLAGFNAAAASTVQSVTQPAATGFNATKAITILFGSQTGNAEKLAEKLCRQL